MEQLHRIISYNHQHMDMGKKSTGQIIASVRDGHLHRRIEESCPDPFVTVSLNIDGIQPNCGSNKWIWPILLVVNELPKRRQFSPENLILSGVWPGPTKPSRAHMSLFLEPVVTELMRLERGEDFCLLSHSTSSSNVMTRIRVFLIGACCDQPAQALIQNVSEPIAAFGCGRYEIEGE